LSAEAATTLASYGADPLLLLAEQLLEQQAASLPDLSPHVILLPRGAAVFRFRSILIAAAAARGHAALLPPWIGTLAAWLERFAPADTPLLTEAARELVLLDALAEFPDLKMRFGAWPLIDSLLKLFDELTLHIGQLPDAPDEFERLLRDGYRAKNAIPPLDAEAQRIYGLWTAWNQHLANERLCDPARRRRAALAASVEQLSPGTHVYLAGLTELTEAEISWVRVLQKRGQLSLLLHGQVGTRGYHPDATLTDLMHRLGIGLQSQTGDAYTRWLDDSFRIDGAALRDRARGFAAAHSHSPAIGRLHLFDAGDLEQEARAIDLQVRRWRHAGRQNIGIVTNDRKLARRVRALLERANIRLRDSGGWALSTTSAATALVRWLECLEQNFAHTPLLDLLKSPFITLSLPPSVLERAAADLDRHVIRAQAVVAGLDQYRAALPRAGRAAVKSGRVFADVPALLDRLAYAAAPLRDVVQGRARSPAEYIEILLSSLERLGLVLSYRADDAGTELLAALDELRHASTGRAIRMAWPEFHRWLQRDLERRRFRSPGSAMSVELLDVAESRCVRFDGLIVGGCTRDQLPGNPGLSPFFNEAVRAHLGLPSREQRFAAAFYDFRRLLESAPDVLLTYRRIDAGETLLPCPWIERFNAFHKLAYGIPLDDGGLAPILKHPATLLTRREAPLPECQQMPAPQVPHGTMPATLSARSHQRLIDCPYQFYATDVLGLVSLEAVREEVGRADYGERIHRILQAFHHGVSGLPGPWSGPLDEVTRPAAEALLHDITRAAFADDVTRWFSARSWLYRWEAIIPAYLDWQQARMRDAWHAEASELRLAHTLAERPGLSLIGRIDRLDRGPPGQSLIDYKTGQLPDLAAVEAGEEVQLPFYTLLVDGAVEEIRYVGLHNEGIDDSRRLAGARLQTLRHRLRVRLIELLGKMEQGASLPAWGDEETCGYCAMEGICRKQMWTEQRE